MLPFEYDIMAHKDSDYNWAAFQRRTKETFLEREVYLCAVEDLIIGKLNWYNMSRSEKQLGDLMYLVKSPDINWDYLNNWVERLNIATHGILGKDGKRDGGSSGPAGPNLLFFPRE
jgi:hypothetical protein